METTQAYYSPFMGQNYMQMVNISPLVPTQADLSEWLKYPEKHDKQLRDVSQYLDNSIMQYKRAKDHFSKLLTMRYDMRAINKPKSGDTATWKSGYERCLNFLRIFNAPNQFTNVLDKTLSEGGIFTYLRKRNNKNNIEDIDDMLLIEIPSDYCYITGKSRWGFTYAINLVWFDRIIGVEYVVPEIYEYYKLFVKMRENKNIPKNLLHNYQFFPVPVENGFVFTFNPLRAQITPPFQGIFKDALAILDYKALLRQKTTMDTWKLIAQTIPKNSDGEPIMDAKVAAKVTQAIQQSMPTGAITFSTPFEITELNMQNAQSQNNIIGLGEQMFWRSIGVNGTIMDLGEKSAASLKFGLINDVGFVEHIYKQFEDFINLQLYLQSKIYQFRVSFYGNRYTEDEDVKRQAEMVRTANMPVGKLFGLLGYQPFEVDAVLEQEEILGWKDKMKPMTSAFNTKGFTGDESKDQGGQKKNEAELTQGGAEQRDYDANKTNKV